MGLSFFFHLPPSDGLSFFFSCLASPKNLPYWSDNSYSSPEPHLHREASGFCSIPSLSPSLPIYGWWYLLTDFYFNSRICTLLLSKPLVSRFLVNIKFFLKTPSSFYLIRKTSQRVLFSDPLHWWSGFLPHPVFLARPQNLFLSFLESRHGLSPNKPHTHTFDHRSVTSLVLSTNKQRKKKKTVSILQFGGPWVSNPLILLLDAFLSTCFCNVLFPSLRNGLLGADNWTLWIPAVMRTASYSTMEHLFSCVLHAFEE